MRQSPRSFVDKLDFRTSVGTRVSIVVTDLAVFHRRPADRVLHVDALHPGVTLDDLRASMGWRPKFGEGELVETAPPTQRELALIRDELDPAGVYTK